jgi:Asp-tRNA(Asn)/Glu-tRNA(Gln) amidotransferase A subunit family amidase
MTSAQVPSLITEHHIIMYCARVFGLTLTVLVATATPTRAADFDLSTASIADINAAIDAGALSSEKLVTLYLKRIDAYDKKGPKVNSVITLNAKALAQAKALDAERKTKGRRSPLHGIPIVVKDLIDVAGMPTTAGFKPFGAPMPLRDAAIVTRLTDAGAIILAKVATANWFGNGFDATHPIGASLNPYSLAHSPGGSSNGVGVAMAAWFAAAGVGTDTGGSVVGPSSFCSLAGMTATQGLVSRSGIVPRGATQDRAGPMGRNVYDIALLLTYMSGWDAEDLMTTRGIDHFPESNLGAELTAPDLKGRRIGVLREMIPSGAQHAEGLALFERSLEDLRKGGAQIIDPVLTGLNLRALTTSQAGRTAEYEKLYVQNAYLERLGPNRPFKTIQEMIEKVGRDKFDKLMLDALTLEAPQKSADYAARVRNKDMVKSVIVELIEKYQLDALVLPYSTLPPPRLDAEGNGGGGGNSLTSNSGLPAVLMPAGYTKENLPIALQITGKPFDDLKLLQIAYGYEQVGKRRHSPTTTPPLPGEVFTY